MSGNGGNARGSADSWMVAQQHGEHQAQDKPRRQQQDAGRDRRDEVHLEEIERLDVGMDEQRRTGDQAEQGAPERAEQERGDRDGNQLRDGVGHPLVRLPQAHQAQLGERERDRGDGHRENTIACTTRPRDARMPPQRNTPGSPILVSPTRVASLPSKRRGVPRQPWGHYIVRTAHPARSRAEGPSEIVEPHEGMRGGTPRRRCRRRSRSDAAAPSRTEGRPGLRASKQWALRTSKRRRKTAG